MVPGRWRIPAASGREYFATAGHTRQLPRHFFLSRGDFSLFFYFLQCRSRKERDRLCNSAKINTRSRCRYSRDILKCVASPALVFYLPVSRLFCLPILPKKCTVVVKRSQTFVFLYTNSCMCIE